MEEEFYCTEEKKPDTMGFGFFAFTCMVVGSMLFATLV